MKELDMGKTGKISLPSLNFVAKVTMTLVALVLVVNMLPASWNVKKWFMF